jgi:hypothetical protein
MKKLILFFNQLADSFLIFFDFLVFLLSPEDSTDRTASTMKGPPIARFDNHCCGAIKIFFWIGFAVFFPPCLLVFCKMLL